MAPVNLRSIKSFKSLLEYLENELGWPLQQYGFDDLTFSYEPADLGLREEDAVHVKSIHQLRPLESGQAWGIFFVEFERKKLPVGVLRRILSHLVVKKRASSNKSDAAAWHTEDLLFISAFGDEEAEQRELAFAHFHQESGDLPTLRVLGWDEGDTPLKLAHVDHSLRTHLHWPANPKDRKAWRSQWGRAFKHRLGHVIRTSDQLAEVLAALAKRIRDRCQRMLKSESDRGPLTRLYKGFQASLIHDLKEEGFADTYAQTITYGLLTAAISRTDLTGGRHGTALIADNVADMVPITNPFLKEMLQTFLKAGGRKGGIDFDELGVQDVVELLRGDETDLPAILRDFGNKTRGEDPVIHFYEHFLSAYNKQLKIQRGVFYTPQPVVSYIVRSVHELLQTEFGLADGLADTTTWGEMLKKHPGLKLPPLTDEQGEKRTISPDEPFVQILDPATGTATFLVEVIDVIHRTLAEKWKQQRFTHTQQQAAWNDYVPKYLLPRLHAFELMMAPYAIAHMKIGLKLVETGYGFGTEERARIYLTNALEPSVKQVPLIGFEALAHEATAVNEIKWSRRFTVVIGNPPYSALSANLSPENRRLVDRYRSINGVRIKERSMLQFEKNIQDDYIKFFVFGQGVVETSGVGILGFVTNHSYLDGPTLRGMRASLSNTFPVIDAIDLHGNSNKKESLTRADENVFDIQQGVAVALLRRSDSLVRRCGIGHLFGTRTDKYHFLASHTLATTPRRPCEPRPEMYHFIAFESNTASEYEEFVQIEKLFLKNSMGTKTGFNELLIDFTREALVEKITRFSSEESSTAELREEFDAKTGHAALVLGQRKQLCSGDWAKWVKPFQLFPFDYRWAFLRKEFLQGHRFGVMLNLSREHPGLVAMRQTKEGYGIFVTGGFCGHKLLGSYDSNNVFPVFDLAIPGMTFVDRRVLNAQLKGTLAEAGAPTELDLLNYAYAVFHSPSYRSRYAEFLKIDFPRLPLTGNSELFRELARLGGELTALHLLESPKLEKPITEFVGGRAPLVEKVSWSEKTVWIDKDESIGFRGVPEKVWNFHIGGYQVCEKWLKDRKGRKLLKDDIDHYHKIVVALSETIRLMAEIDKVIEKHGGWPGAFVTTESKSRSESPANPSTAKAPSSDIDLQTEDELPLG